MFYDIQINGSVGGVDNGVTFPMWVERYMAHGVDVWVNITDTIPQNGAYIIKIRYNNSAATNPYNIWTTFPGGDDFSSAPSASNWTIAGTTPTVSDAIAKTPALDKGQVQKPAVPP
jgi:hypothetical protein